MGFDPTDRPSWCPGLVSLRAESDLLVMVLAGFSSALAVRSKLAAAGAIALGVGIEIQARLVGRLFASTAGSGRHTGAR